MFAWLPAESIIHDRQREYYETINESNKQGESTTVILLMLAAIKFSIMETIEASNEMIDETTSKEERRWLTVRNYLKYHECIQNTNVCILLNTFPGTVN